MSSLLKNLLFALGLALIVWLGYALFIQNDEDSLTSSEDGISSQATLETQEFLIRLNELKVIEIEGAVFSDRRFSSLTDFRLPLRPEPTGRENPFAPIE